MRLLLQAIILIPSICFANLCKEENPLAAQYKAQKSWQEISITEPDIPGSVEGVVDKANNFYPFSMNRKKNYEAKIKVDQANRDYKDFYKLCRMKGKNRQSVASLREEGHKNKYTFSAQYLPKLEGFNNNPYDSLDTASFKLRINYSPKAILTSIYDAEDVQAQIYKTLVEQVKRQNKIGTYTFSLSGMDDFVCDLMHGDAIITIYRRMGAQTPIVIKEEAVAADSVIEVYKAWRSAIQLFQSEREKIFNAGSVLGKLHVQQQAEDLSEKLALNLLDQFMKSDFSELKPLSTEEVLCAADNLQEYHTPYIKHLINTEFSLDKEAHLYPGTF